MTYQTYIHAPWCTKHCPYCNFTVYVDKNPPFIEWKDQILANWNWHQTHMSNAPETLYFGGGTPSLLPVYLLKEIIDTITDTSTTEITIEVNPGDVNKDTLQAYQDIGINRVSLGIQTFNTRFERILGRQNTIAQATELLEMVAESNFHSWSFDIMFGIASQTLDELAHDIEKILHIRPPHVSLYGLTYKEGTPLYRALQKGTIKDISEDLWADMFQLLTESLENAGYTRYEVSNFSLPNHRSKHNEQIWKNGHYIGLGPSAHGFLPNGQRAVYPSVWHEWKKNIAPILETPTQENALTDFIITAIRHIDGISRRELQRFQAYIANPNSQDPILQYTEWTEEWIRLRKNGWILADSITHNILNRISFL